MGMAIKLNVIYQTWQFLSMKDLYRNNVVDIYDIVETQKKERHIK